MIPKLQEPTDLSLVIAGQGALGPVTVVQQATVRWQDLEMTFSVLCESHEVILRRNDQVVLHELLSCVKAVNDGSYLHFHSLRDGLCHSYDQEGYSVHVTARSVPPGGIVPPDPKLYVAFPSAVRGGTTPFTSIHWEAHDDEFIWRTIHLYALPNHAVGVFSTSRVDRSVGRSAGSDPGPRSATENEAASR